MLQYFADETREALLFASPGVEYVNGEAQVVPGTVTPTTISIVKPQPLTGKDRQMLSDGEHVQDYVKTWTMDDVDQADNDGNGPDHIRILNRNGGPNNEVFRIKTLQDRRDEGGALQIVMRLLTPSEISKANIGITA